jgi:putative transposase
MPWSLKRFQQTEQTHFITFSCYHRKPKFNAAIYEHCLQSLERMRRKYRFLVFGYVLMPEHVHLLVSEPEMSALATAIQALKISVARFTMKSVAEDEPFWQARYHDHNVRNPAAFIGKLKYIHGNPVKRRLVDKPENWPWSSFRHYAFAELGPVEIESRWTADYRRGKIPKLLDIKSGSSD